MSSDELAIKAENVTKTFKIDGKAIRRGPSETVERADARRLFKNRFTALDDVSLCIAKGETVGIMGRNGAGKSTLLKIVSGMMKPDSGTVSLAGPAYSVMGMGIGFDRNLSGRENIQIKGAVMGANPAQIQERFDWIVDFAELGDFIHQPLRTYSKGMLSRLAFAITFAFDPEILIVDEALSGGDGAFKRKAAARLAEINDSGATILLVSHGPAFHTKLCDRCILLDKGRILKTGRPAAITSFYDLLLETPQSKEDAVIESIRNAVIAETVENDSSAAAAETASAFVEPEADFFDEALGKPIRSESKPQGARIQSVEFVHPKSGEKLNTFLANSNLRLTIDVEFLSRMDEVEAEVTLKTEDGTDLFTKAVRRSKAGPSRFRKDLEHTFWFNLKNRLLKGTYYVDAVVRGDTGRGVAVQHRVSDALVFRSMGQPGVEGLVDLQR